MAASADGGAVAGAADPAPRRPEFPQLTMP